MDAKELLYEASHTIDPFEDVADSLEQMAVNQKSQEGVDAIKNLTALLDGLGTDHLVDTGVVRGLGFYTATVFQTDVHLEDEVIGEVAGGGRYDDLVGDFMEESELDRMDVPATGFGWGLERIADALMKSGYTPESDTGVDTVVYSTDPVAAMQYADSLRGDGTKVHVYHGDDRVEAERIAAARGADLEEV